MDFKMFCVVQFQNPVPLTDSIILTHENFSCRYATREARGEEKIKKEKIMKKGTPCVPPNPIFNHHQPLANSNVVMRAS